SVETTLPSPALSSPPALFQTKFFPPALAAQEVFLAVFEAHDGKPPESNPLGSPKKTGSKNRLSADYS
ncbi:MAG: hypothetical protein LBK27_04735, partial [Treponema sp.]|nr:hypothetical protein [Treponema sp.]